MTSMSLTHSQIVHIFSFVALILIVLALLIAYAAQYDREQMNLLAAGYQARKSAYLINPEFHDRYAFAVKAGAEHFPGLKVWGEHIQDGTGYAVFFTDGKIKSAWQVRSTICVNEKNHQIDLLDANDRDDQIKIALEAVQKSMNQFAMANGTNR